MQIERVSARPGPLRCPYCHDEVVRGGASCPECEAVHHKVCLYERPTCSSCGADMAETLAQAVPPVSTPETPSLWPRVVAAGLVLTAILLAGLSVFGGREEPAPPSALLALEAPDERGGDESDADLIKLLSSGNPKDRARAASALRRRGPVTDALPALVNRLNDPVDQVREQAVSTLLEFGPQLRLVNSRLVELLSADSPAVRAGALNLLSRQGPPLPPESQRALVATIADPEPSLRSAALTTLATTGDSAWRTLAAALLSPAQPGPGLRDAGPHLTPAARPLTELVRRQVTSPTQQALARALAAIPGPESLEGLVLLLEERGEVAASLAQNELVRRGPKATSVVPTLQRLLKGRHGPTARRAFDVLTAIQGTETAAIAAIREAPSPIRLVAVSALRTSDHPQALRALTDALADSDRRVGQAAFAALDGRAAPELTPLLLDALERPAARSRAGSLLAHRGPPAVLSLLEALRARPALQPGAIVTLSRLKPSVLHAHASEVAPVLATSLGQAGSVTQQLAMRALLTLGSRATPALDVLIAHLESRSPVTRQLSLKVLARLGNGALEPIRRARSDPDPNVARAAEAAWTRHQRRIHEEQRRRLDLRPQRSDNTDKAGGS